MAQVGLVSNAMAQGGGLSYEKKRIRKKSAAMRLFFNAGFEAIGYMAFVPNGGGCLSEGKNAAIFQGSE